MFYKFIDLPTAGIAEQVLTINSTSTHKDIISSKEKTFKFTAPDAYKDCSALVQAVECITSWQNVFYIALVHTPPGVVDIHVDFDLYDDATVDWDATSPKELAKFKLLFKHRHQHHLSPWALNFPITNCDTTYTAFYQETQHTNPKFQVHPKNGFPYYTFDQTELEEVDRLYLHQPAFFNTQEIHGAINNTDQDRYVLTVRFNFNLADRGWI